MALDLETLRSVAKNEELPILTGEALVLSEEKSKLRKESIDIKVNGEGRDEIPGTLEYERLQVIGGRLQEISKRIEELQGKID
ncbi:MAG: hypothetical protein KBC21_00425 [Candidatus Pacebacteria bacterium]|nr:hypothetical protein [Candidatus Paceibacterota bacterium]